ncbi:hypothetical protein K461DRAFT_291592 [Myriangium duriaei CBS 260.36]|uniref:DUF7726 domain-containing protein n=1 Tax=Myriangium duriaei CBS 260.36 TaxID=1168546 RepID=A0A9P4J923_9PEZI|nr:hypothetical protein K461DRAFT_291592 [Myriangium duriaei CBS 260.36]
MPSKVANSTSPLKRHDPNVANSMAQVGKSRGKKRSHDETVPRTLPDIGILGSADDKLNELLGKHNTAEDNYKPATKRAKTADKAKDHDRGSGSGNDKAKDKAKIDGKSTSKDGDKHKSKTNGKKKGNSKDDDKDQYDFSDIHLDGEEKEAVKIYDTAQDMRNKINAHFRKSHMSQAELGRRLGDMFPEPQNIAGRQIKTFLMKKGVMGGADGPVYYASYVLFEKLRIKTGGKESKKRLGIKESNPKGCERYDVQKQGLTVCGDEAPYVDKVGKLHIVDQKTGRSRL